MPTAKWSSGRHTFGRKKRRDSVGSLEPTSSNNSYGDRGVPPNVDFSELGMLSDAEVVTGSLGITAPASMSKQQQPQQKHNSFISSHVSNLWDRASSRRRVMSTVSKQAPPTVYEVHPGMEKDLREVLANTRKSTTDLRSSMHSRQSFSNIPRAAIPTSGPAPVSILRKPAPSQIPTAPSPASASSAPRSRIPSYHAAQSGRLSQAPPSRVPYSNGRASVSSSVLTQSQSSATSGSPSKIPLAAGSGSPKRIPVPSGLPSNGTASGMVKPSRSLRVTQLNVPTPSGLPQPRGRQFRKSGMFSVPGLPPPGDSESNRTSMASSLARSASTRTTMTEDPPSPTSRPRSTTMPSAQGQPGQARDRRSRFDPESLKSINVSVPTSKEEARYSAKPLPPAPAGASAISRLPSLRTKVPITVSTAPATQVRDHIRASTITMMPTVADVEQTHVPPLLVAPPLPTEGVDVYAVSQKLEGMSPPKALTEHYLRGSPLAADNSLGLEQPPSVVSSTDMSRESSAPLESTPLTNRDASGRPTRKGTFGWNTPVSHRGATPEREREPSVPRREQLTFTQPFQAAAQPIIVPLKDESDDHDPTINRPRKDTFGPLDFRPPYSADGNSTPSPTRSTPGIDGLETSYQPLITPATPRKNQDATAPVEYRPVASPAPDATRPVSGNWFTTGADVEPAPAPGLAPEAAQSPELDTGARPASGGWFLDPPASTEARPPMVRSDTEEERQALRTMPRSAVTPISWPLNNTSAASMASSVASVVDETPMVSAAGSPMSTSDSIVESEAHAPLLTESSVTSDSEDDVFISPPMAPYISDPPETPSEYMTPFEDSEGDDTTSSEAAQVTPKHQATKSMTPTTPRTLLEAPFPQTSPEAAASPRATPKTAVTEIASPRYHPLLSPRNVPARDSPVRPAPPTLDVERARQEDVDSDSDELSPTDPMIITPAVDAFFGPDSQGVSPKSAKSAPAPAFVRDLAAEYEAGSPRRWSPLRPRMFPSPEPDAALADASFTIPRSMSTRSVASADKIKQDTMDALEELEKLVNQEMRTQEEISLQCTPMSDEVDVMPTVPTIVDLSESPFVPSEPLPQVEAAVEMDAEVSLRDILASAPDTTILDEPPLSATTISSSRSSSFGLEYLRRSIGSEPCEDRPLGYQRSIPSESGSPLPLSLSSLNRLSPIPPNRLPLPAGASPPPNPPPVLSPSPLWAQSPLLLSTQHPTKAVESPSSPGTATPAGTAVATLVTERAQEDSPIDEFPPRPASHASSIPDPVSSAAARALMASPVRGSSPCTVETGESNETVRAAIKRRPPPLRTTPPLTSKSLIVGSDKFNDTLEQLSAALGTAFRLSSNGMYVQASASDLSVIMERIKKIRLPESATTNNGTHLSPARVSPHAPPLSAFGPSVFPGHKRSPRSSPAPSPRGYSGPNSPATPMSATTKAYYPSPPVVAREKVSTAPRPVSSDLVGASDASRVTRTDSVRSSSGGSETASTRRHLHTEGLRRIEREEAAIFRKANKHHGHGGSLPGSPRTKRPSRTPVSSVSPVGSPQALESMANRYPRVPLARSSRGSRTAASISSLMELTKQATASETGSQLERRASSSSLGHSVFQVPRKPLPCDSGDWSQTQGTPASLYGPLADVRETARETADISPSIYMPNPAQYRPEPGYLARAEPVYAAEPEPPVYAAEPEPAYTQVPVGRLPPPRPEQVIAAKSTGFGYGYQIPRAFADGRSPTTPQFEPSSLSQFQTMPMPLPPVAVAMPPPPPVATATSTSRMKPPRSYRLTFGRD